jgi:hypothetical protein
MVIPNSIIPRFTHNTQSTQTPAHIHIPDLARTTPSQATKVILAIGSRATSNNSKGFSDPLEVSETFETESVVSHSAIHNEINHGYRLASSNRR